MFWAIIYKTPEAHPTTALVCQAVRKSDHHQVSEARSRDVTDIAAVTAGMAIVTATAATFKLSDNYSAPIGAESTIGVVFGGENMNNDYSRDEVRRILNTTPEQAEADALFNEMLNYLGSLYDEDRELMERERILELDEMCKNSALILDQRAIQEMKETVQFFRECGADVSYRPDRRILAINGSRTPVLDADILVIADSEFSVSGDDVGWFLDVLNRCSRSFDCRTDCDAIQLDLSWTIGRYFKVE